MQVELDILNLGEIVKRRKTRAEDEKSDPDCPIVITKKHTSLLTVTYRVFSL